MKLRGWPLLLAALLAGCAGEKGIVDRGDYKVDTRPPPFFSSAHQSAGYSLHRR
ncbi:N-acetylmuramoyl-L-alanine amidase [Cronobacter sakazakii 696]|nr:N-acetylmuramoyl-L-alanine amidase [Cronobacter sakazakii 696]